MLTNNDINKLLEEFKKVFTTKDDINILKLDLLESQNGIVNDIKTVIEITGEIKTQLDSNQELLYKHIGEKVYHHT